MNNMGDVSFQSPSLPSSGGLRVAKETTWRVGSSQKHLGIFPRDKQKGNSKKNIKQGVNMEL